MSSTTPSDQHRWTKCSEHVRLREDHCEECQAARSFFEWFDEVTCGLFVVSTFISVKEVELTTECEWDYLMRLRLPTRLGDVFGVIIKYARTTPNGVLLQILLDASSNICFLEVASKVQLERLRNGTDVSTNAV